jgi:Flp pilus assembly protein TadD
MNRTSFCAEIRLASDRLTASGPDSHLRHATGLAMAPRAARPRSSTAIASAAGTISQRRLMAEGCLLFCLTMAVYLPSLSSGFIWDDDDYVTENATLRSIAGLRQIWLEPGSTPQYYPLVFTTFWVEQHLWGLNPAGYHFVNALLHAANAVGVWLILRRLAIPGAWLAAALFALHPVHVESVAWVTERKNLLSACFYLLALWQFLPWVEGTTSDSGESRGRLSLGGYALGFACFVAALLSKSVTCSLPAVLLLLRWWKSGWPSWRAIAPMVPLFIVGGILALNTSSLERQHVGASGDAFSWTPAERFLIAGRALWTYAINLVWPIDLCFVYPRWTILTSSPWAWLIALAAFAVPVGLAVGQRRLSGLLLAVLCFGGTLLPALGFFNIFPMRYTFVADHYQYLASLAILTLIAAWWMVPFADGRWTWRSPSPAHLALDVRRAVAAVVLAALGCLTWQREGVFHDSWTLWSHTVAGNPTSMIANIQMGRLSSRRKDFAAAEQYLRDGLRYRTDDLETHEFETNLAHALSAQGKLAEAAVEFHQALDRKPDYPEALNGLGNVLARQSDYRGAIELYRKSLAGQPENAAIRTNLANALVAAGDSAGAEREYRAAIESDPAAVAPRLGLALVLARAGQLEQAESQCLDILRLEPGHEATTRLLNRIRLDRRYPRPRGASSPAK